MALPANLSYFLSRMQGVSTNYFKIFPNNTGTASPNKILRFELPSNSLLNLRSICSYVLCKLHRCRGRWTAAE